MKERALFVTAMLMTWGLAGAVNTCSNDSKTVGSYCVAGLLRDLLAAPGVNWSAAAVNPRSAVAAAVDSYLGQCMGLTAPQLKPVNILVMIQSHNYGAELLAEVMEAQTGFQANISFVDIPELTSAVAADFTSPSGPSLDGFAIDPSAAVDLTALDALAPLEGLVWDDNELQWSDVLPYIRQVATVYDGHLIGIPFTGQVSVMYYRKDILAAMKLAVPNTWEELLSVATTLNGTDLNGDGTPDYGICWQVEGCLEAPVIISQIVAPYIQSKGTTQGWMFDPGDMSLLLNSTAMLYALELLRELQAVAAPMPNCEKFHVPFLEGSCAFSIKWGEQFKATEFMPNAARGNLGVAQLPGSTRVLDRPTGRLVPCTNVTCPLAKLERDPTSGRPILVNRAPHFGFGGFAGAVRKAADPGYQRAVYRYFANLAGANISFEMLLTFGTLIGPFRYSHVDLANLHRWVAAGYHENDTVSFLAAWTSSMADPNIALDIRIINSYKYRYILYEAASYAALTSMPLADILSSLVEKFELVLAESGGRQAVQEAYRTALGITVHTSPPPPPSKPPAPGHSIQVQGYMPVMSPALALLVLLAVYVAWARSQGRTLFGAPRPPGPGPDTTLLVATLPDLPYLLRDLPEPVVERALTQYLAMVRHLLWVHRGYEALPCAADKALGGASSGSLAEACSPSSSALATSPTALAAAAAAAGGPQVHSVAGPTSDTAAQLEDAQLLTPAAALRFCGAAGTSHADAAAADGSGDDAAITAPAAVAAPEQRWALVAAFRSPRHALKFAAALTLELLTLDWPQQLLSHPACAPLFALPATTLPPEPAEELCPPLNETPTETLFLEAALQCRQSLRAEAALSATATDTASAFIGGGGGEAGEPGPVGRRLGRNPNCGMEPEEEAGADALQALQASASAQHNRQARLRRPPMKESSIIARTLLGRRRVFSLVRNNTLGGSFSTSSEASLSVSPSGGPDMEASRGAYRRPSVVSRLAGLLAAPPPAAATDPTPASSATASPFASATLAASVAAAVAAPPPHLPPVRLNGLPHDPLAAKLPSALLPDLGSPSPVTSPLAGRPVSAEVPAWLSDIADPLDRTPAASSAATAGARGVLSGPRVSSRLLKAQPFLSRSRPQTVSGITSVWSPSAHNGDAASSVAHRTVPVDVDASALNAPTGPCSSGSRRLAHGYVGLAARVPSAFVLASSSRSRLSVAATGTGYTAAAGARGGAAPAAVASLAVESSQRSCPSFWLASQGRVALRRPAAPALRSPLSRQQSSAAAGPSAPQSRNMHIEEVQAAAPAQLKPGAAPTGADASANVGAAGAAASDGSLAILRAVRMAQYYRAAFKVFNLYGQLMSYLQGGSGGGGSEEPAASGPGGQALGAYASGGRDDLHTETAQLGAAACAADGGGGDSMVIRGVADCAGERRGPFGRRTGGSHVTPLLMHIGAPSEAPCSGSVTPLAGDATSGLHHAGDGGRLLQPVPGHPLLALAPPQAAPQSLLATATSEDGLSAEVRTISASVRSQAGPSPPSSLPMLQLTWRQPRGGGGGALRSQRNSAAWSLGPIGSFAATALQQAVDGARARASDWLGEQGAAQSCDPLLEAVMAEQGVLIHRGLRVCMGLSSGVAASHVRYCPTAKRTRYGGPSLAIARCLSYAAYGTASRLLLADSCFKRLGAGAGSDPSAATTVLNIGEYRLQRPSTVPHPLDVYMALPPRLGPCLAAHLPPRGSLQTQAGVLEAPVGDVTIVFANVVGANALLAWDTAEAKAALAQMQRLACRRLAELGGYLVEAADGLLLAAFTQPAAAVRWGLSIVSRLMAEDWSARLLQHELCEEVVVLANDTRASRGAGDSSGGNNSGYAQWLLERKAARREARQSGLQPQRQSPPLQALQRLGAQQGPQRRQDSPHQQSLAVQAPQLQPQQRQQQRQRQSVRRAHSFLLQRSLPRRPQEHPKSLPGQAGNAADREGPRFARSESGCDTDGDSKPKVQRGSEGGNSCGGKGAAGGGAVREADRAPEAVLQKAGSLRPPPVALLLYRGLRLRVGIDAGPAKAEVSVVTGRAAYKGRVMNRAARIAAKAAAGQVWCSDVVWRIASQGPAPQAQEQARALADGPNAPEDGNGDGDDGESDAEAEAAEAMLPLSGRYQGRHALKGVSEAMDLWCCRFGFATSSSGGAGASTSGGLQSAPSLANRTSPGQRRPAQSSDAADADGNTQAAPQPRDEHRATSARVAVGMGAATASAPAEARVARCVALAPSSSPAAAVVSVMAAAAAAGHTGHMLSPFATAAHNRSPLSRLHRSSSFAQHGPAATDVDSSNCNSDGDGRCTSGSKSTSGTARGKGARDLLGTEPSSLLPDASFGVLAGAGVAACGGGGAGVDAVSGSSRQVTPLVAGDLSFRVARGPPAGSQLRRKSPGRDVVQTLQARNSLPQTPQAEGGVVDELDVQLSFAPLTLCTAPPTEERQCRQKPSEE